MIWRWLVLVWLLSVGSAVADDSPHHLADLVRTLEQPNLDQWQQLTVSRERLTHQDFSIVLDSGAFHAFSTVSVGEQALVPGAIWRGSARVRFTPVLSVERDQLRRFVDSSVFVGDVTELVFYFDARIWSQLVTMGSLRRTPPPATLTRRLGDHLRHLSAASPYFAGEAAQALVQPTAERFLLVTGRIESGQRFVYLFDPSANEEVQFYLWSSVRDGRAGWEIVCRYSMFAAPNYFLINGVDRRQLRPLHVDLDARIDGSGRLVAETTIRAVVALEGARLLPFRLDPRFRIETISRPDATPVTWVDRTRDDNIDGLRQFYIATEPLTYGDTVAFTVVYRGDIGQRRFGALRGTTPSEWLPRYGYNDPITYDLTLTLPINQAVVGPNQPEVESVSNSRKRVRWAVDRPTSLVALMFGNYDLDQTQVKGSSIEMYTQPALRPDELESAWRVDEKLALADFSGAYEFFSATFGSLPLPSLTIAEFPGWHGVSLPGLLQIGSHSFYEVGPRGYARIFRAHEVAHQWWGTTVRPAGYRDEWLSEGMAEYAALLYLQAKEGDQIYYDWLTTYSRELLSMRARYSRDENPIPSVSLGYRAESSRSVGAYDLVVYRKGALILHMIRMLMTDYATGDDRLFFAMLRECFERYRDREISTRDFKWMVEKYIGLDMTWFFSQWVYGTEIPRLDTSSRTFPVDGRWGITIRIRQENVSASFRSWVPVAVDMHDGTTRWHLLHVDGDDVYYSLPTTAERPLRITINPNLAVLAQMAD